MRKEVINYKGYTINKVFIFEHLLDIYYYEICMSGGNCQFSSLQSAKYYINHQM